MKKATLQKITLRKVSWISTMAFLFLGILLSNWIFVPLDSPIYLWVIFTWLAGGMFSSVSGIIMLISVRYTEEVPLFCKIINALSAVILTCSLILMTLLPMDLHVNIPLGLLMAVMLFSAVSRIIAEVISAQELVSAFFTEITEQEIANESEL